MKKISQEIGFISREIKKISREIFRLFTRKKAATFMRQLYITHCIFHKIKFPEIVAHGRVICFTF
jgi:hypothetical protein